MDELLVLLGRYRDRAGAVWEYFEPEREWLRDQSLAIRGQFETVMQRIQTIARWAIAWPFIITIVAILFPALETDRITWVNHFGQAVIPILAFAPVLLLLWLLTTGVSLAGLTVIAAVPATAPLGVGKLFGLLRATIKKLALVLLAELLMGVYLSVVPIAKDPGLVPLLVLVTISLGIASIIIGKGWIRTVLILFVLGTTLIFFLGGRDKAGKQLDDLVTSATNAPASGMQTPAAFKDIQCTDATLATDLSGQKFPVGGKFEYRLHAGCFAKLVMPDYGNWEGNPENPVRGQWLSFRCNTKYVPPMPITGNADAHCDEPGFYQGEGTLIFVKK